MIQFTIGEMSKLHGIPEPTLRYYDRIGLFKPATVNKDTGYRYYSPEQFEQLNIIQYLKYLGIPLKEMQNHFKNRDEKYFLQLLMHYKAVNEKKLNDLTIIQNRFNQRIEELKITLMIDDIGVARIERLKARHILCIREQIGNRPELEISLKKLEKTTRVNSSLFIGRVGVSIAQKDLEQRNFTRYSAISIFPEEIIDKEQSLVTLAEGEYGCIYCREPLFESTEYYEKLLDYIDAQGYVVAGDSVERLIIDQFITKAPHKHLTEIQIPIGKGLCG
ncbi:MAG: MerR family transcriptional regulator [Negativicutes bacterium]|nr:MerR family transcriptional regulator [Negativicutes bacterium]